MLPRYSFYAHARSAGGSTMTLISTARWPGLRRGHHRSIGLEEPRAWCSDERRTGAPTALDFARVRSPSPQQGHRQPSGRRFITHGCSQVRADLYHCHDRYLPVISEPSPHISSVQPAVRAAYSLQAATSPSQPARLLGRFFFSVETSRPSATATCIRRRRLRISSRRSRFSSA